MKMHAKKWWKSVKKIVGTTSHNFTLGNVESENMSNRQRADYINKFFTSLTKDYPRINMNKHHLGVLNTCPKLLFKV